MGIHSEHQNYFASSGSLSKRDTPWDLQMIPQESISMIMIVIWMSNKNLFLRLIIMHCLFDLSIKTMWYTGVNVQKWGFLHCYACYALVLIDWTNKTKYSLKFNLKTGHNEKHNRTFMLSKFHFQSVLKVLKQTVWHSSFFKNF